MAKNVVLKITEKGAKKTAGALKSVGGAVASVGKAASLVGGGLAILSTKLAGDFQKSLLEVSTLMKDFSDKDLKIMSRELRSVAASSGLALDSISKAKYDIVSAGFANAADSALILNASTRLAVGGVTTAASAADLLTTSLNAMGKDARDVNEVSDILFTTVRLGKTTMTELGASLGQVLPFAKSMNLSLADVGASMATLTASGVKTTEATTALRAAITALSSPSEGAKVAMAQAGIEVQKFDDGTVDLLSTIEQFVGMDPEVIGKFIPNVRAILGIQTMANNFETLRDNVNQFSEESAGATDKAFEKMAKGFNQQMAMIKNSAQAIMIEVGNIIIDKTSGGVLKANEVLQELGDIGWDIIGQTISANMEVVMSALGQVVDAALTLLKSNAKLAMLKIKRDMTDILPFTTGKVKELDEQIAILTESLALETKNRFASAKKQMVATFNFIKEKAKETSDKEKAEAVRVFEEKKKLREQNNEDLREKTEEELAIIAAATEQKMEGLTMEELARNDFNAKLDLRAQELLDRGVKEEEVKKFREEQKAKFRAKEISGEMSKHKTLLSLMASATGHSKNLARVTQRISQAEALIKAYEAASKAYARYGGYPAGVAPAAISLASGLANVASISAVKFAQGGIVQGVGNQDTVPAMLTPGELILNQAQQENLVGSSGLTINIQGGVVDESYVNNELIPAINKATSLGASLNA